VDVVAEGDGGVSRLPDAIERAEAAGHAGLHHVAAERADVGDHVDVPGSDVGCAAVDSLKRVCDLAESAKMA
jgi:hypothetical protein